MDEVKIFTPKPLRNKIKQVNNSRHSKSWNNLAEFPVFTNQNVLKSIELKDLKEKEDSIDDFNQGIIDEIEKLSVHNELIDILKTKQITQQTFKSNIFNELDTEESQNIRYSKESDDFFHPLSINSTSSTEAIFEKLVRVNNINNKNKPPRTPNPIHKNYFKEDNSVENDLEYLLSIKNFTLEKNSSQI